VDWLLSEKSEIDQKSVNTANGFMGWHILLSLKSWLSRGTLATTLSGWKQRIESLCRAREL